MLISQGSAVIGDRKVGFLFNVATKFTLRALLMQERHSDIHASGENRQRGRPTPIYTSLEFCLLDVARIA